MLSRSRAAACIAISSKLSFGLCWQRGGGGREGQAKKRIMPGFAPLRGYISEPKHCTGRVSLAFGVGSVPAWTLVFRRGFCLTTPSTTPVPRPRPQPGKDPQLHQVFTRGRGVRALRTPASSQVGSSHSHSALPRLTCQPPLCLPCDLCHHCASICSAHSLASSVASASLRSASSQRSAALRFAASLRFAITHVSE